MQIWQSVSSRWSQLVFRDRYKDITPKIRALRVLEEAMELAQAEGVTPEEAAIIQNQVWSKPPGEPDQELGGVLVCLAGYASTANTDMERCFWDEHLRIMDPVIMEKVRTRNLAGDKIGFEKSPEELDQSNILLKEESLTSDDDDGWRPISEAPEEDGYRAFVELGDGHRTHGFYECGYTWGWIDERGFIIHPVKFKSADKADSARWYLSENRHLSKLRSDDEISDGS